MNVRQILSYTALLFSTISNTVHSENILFYFAIGTYSHRIAVWPLVEKLAESGHNVTFLSPFSPNANNFNSKVHEIVPKPLQVGHPFREGGINILELRFNGEHRSMWSVLPHLSVELCDKTTKDPEFQHWLNKSSFDLIIWDNLWNDCAQGLVKFFNAKQIVYGTTTMFPWQNDLHGTVPETWWIPDLQYYPPEHLPFLDKVTNTVRPISWYLFRKYYIQVKLENILRKNLNMPDMPSLEEIDKNVSLVFLNTHYGEEYARSLPPFIIPIGGIHISNSTKPIPKELDDFVSKGENGFIYVSLGSQLSFKYLRNEVKRDFIGALEECSFQFLVKMDPNDLHFNDGTSQIQLPKNVFISNWMPQQDILAHAKIRGAILHGGVLGIQEAMYYGIPLILIPVFAEQDYNTQRAKNRGYAIQLEITSLTRENLTFAINELVFNKSYKDNMLRASKIFRDRPFGMSALDTAFWWVEYVLRNNETRLFLAPKNSTWFERRLLDVWFFIFCLIQVIILVTIYCTWKCFQFCLSSKRMIRDKIKKT